MSRDLRATLAIMAVALLLCVPVLFAQAPGQPTSSYLALVFQLHPSPTPIPPPLESPVIQRHQMSSDYAVDTSKEVTNQEAAAGYQDLTAALDAFAQQGR